jgi:aryl-alcohol dehydrogenase-like predicted oxidoreductase
MQTTTLGPLTVSRLCLGAMLMGGDTSAGEAHRMLDRFPEAGGTFVDTADTYGDGESERHPGAMAGAAPGRDGDRDEGAVRRLRPRR